MRNLAHDNVVTGAKASAGFEALGIAPRSMEAILPEYLWRFRAPDRAARASSATVLREGAERLRRAGRTERP